MIRVLARVVLKLAKERLVSAERLEAQGKLNVEAFQAMGDLDAHETAVFRESVKLLSVLRAESKFWEDAIADLAKEPPS